MLDKNKEFFWGIFNKSSEATEVILKAPFQMTIQQECFANFKTEKLYEKILNRCYSRSGGAEDDKKIASLFDSVEKSNAPKGLISLLACGMTEKLEFGIIYNSNGFVRVATFGEKQKIKKAYLKNVSQSVKISADEVGILVDFSRYVLTDLIKAYMAMIYDILTSMNTQVGLAKSLQIKISGLRGVVSAAGKDEPIQQAKDVNQALIKGQSVLIDQKDTIETLKLDSTSVQESINMIYGLLASDIGMPLSFVNGELATGMSATGEADSNQQEEGLQDFFNSVFKPVCDKLYNWNLQFVSDDWRWFNAMIGSLISVENSSLLSEEQKQLFADRLIPITKKE